MTMATLSTRANLVLSFLGGAKTIQMVGWGVSRVAVREAFGSYLMQSIPGDMKSTYDMKLPGDRKEPPTTLW